VRNAVHSKSRHGATPSRKTGASKVRRSLKIPRILSLRRAKNPVNSVLVYARVLSTSRPDRVVHNVVKVGRVFRCSCERSVLANERCIHIRVIAAKLVRKAVL